MFPTWPAKSELGHKTKKNASPKAPEGGGQSNALMVNMKMFFYEKINARLSSFPIK